MKNQLIYFFRFYRYINLFIKQLSLFFKRKQIGNTYIFHHLPRCGGTSLRRSIMDSKEVFNDYRLGWGSIYPFKYPLSKFGKNDCLSGHFELEGYHIFQRYPEIYYNKRFKLFTFIRNPFDLSISIYFYMLKMGQNKGIDIRDHLLKNKNYIANILNVNSQNYKKILDRYDFIGIFEEYDQSLIQLSAFFGIESLNKKIINKAEKNDLLNSITQEDIYNFKKQNELDFEIYEYCLNRFNSRL